MLKPGSILSCDLFQGLLYHSGIYVGHDKVVELIPSGIIRIIDTEMFVRYGKYRTGDIFKVACNRYGPICRNDIAERAVEYAGIKKKYNPLYFNCHVFTAACLNGFVNNKVFLFSHLEKEISRVINKGEKVAWCVI